jgi:hypothetical protein
MSKERELLERILVSGIFDSNLFEDWEQYIQELLAQPEQEAVEDRIARWHRLGYEQGKKASKREPLSNEEILVGFPQGVHITTLAFYEGVKFAEKMHGLQDQADIIIKEIQESLAKPEGITPREGLTEYKKGYAKAELDLKREPLSDLDVFTLYEEAEYIGFLAYRKGIKDAEKAHGITGGE